MWHNRSVGRIVKMWGVCICLLILTSPGSVIAQIRTEPKAAPVKVSVEVEKAREQTKWMYRNLTLNTDQYEAVNEINLTYAYKFDSIEKLKSKSAKSDAKLKIRSDKEARIKSVLTPEQFTQFVAHKEKQTSQKKSPFSGTYFGK